MRRVEEQGSRSKVDKGRVELRSRVEKGREEVQGLER